MKYFPIKCIGTSFDTVIEFWTFIDLQLQSIFSWVQVKNKHFIQINKLMKLTYRDRWASSILLCVDNWNLIFIPPVYPSDKNRLREWNDNFSRANNHKKFIFFCSVYYKTFRFPNGFHIRTDFFFLFLNFYLTCQCWLESNTFPMT